MHKKCRKMCKKRKVYLNDYIYETIIIYGYYILLHEFLTV